MNLTQAKALFFSQYLGRTILAPDDDGHAIRTFDWFVNHKFQIHFNHYLFDQNDPMFLLLRSVGELTDEELSNIANILGLKIGRYTEQNILKIMAGNYSIQHISVSQVIVAHEYLKAIGIILPFTYLNEDNKPVTLQPEEIIANGWAKIN